MQWRITIYKWKFSNFCALSFFFWKWDHFLRYTHMWAPKDDYLFLSRSITGRLYILHVSSYYQEVLVAHDDCSWINTQTSVSRYLHFPRALLRDPVCKVHPLAATSLTWLPQFRSLLIVIPRYLKLFLFRSAFYTELEKHFSLLIFVEVIYFLFLTDHW